MRTTMLGAGALVSSAAGLAQLGEAIMWDGSSLLSPQEREHARSEATTRPPFATEPAQQTFDALHLGGYGPGMWSQQIPMPDGTTRTVLGHSGDYGGEKSIVLHDPSTGTTVSVMDNVQSGYLSPLLRLAGKLFAQAEAMPDAARGAAALVPAAWPPAPAGRTDEATHPA